MISDDGPHPLYETFNLPLDALIIPNTNMRRGDPAQDNLLELALSIKERQLQPVLVTWQNGIYELGVGFRRARAMTLFRRDLGFETIRATRIRPEEVDIARLVENFVRKDPTTYETAEYFVQLQTGEGGRTILSMQQIAAAVGKSIEYVRALTRFFRELPTEVRAAWAADQDKRFTFRALNDLVRLKHEGDDSGVARRLEQILKLKPRKPAALGYKPAEECLRETIASLADNEEEKEEARKPRLPRVMPGAEIRRLEEQLSRIGRERLAQHDLDASVLLDLLQAIAGKAPGARATEIVTDIVVMMTPPTVTA